MAAFDAVAFAMGKAGASRDLVSALMGGNGGGGSGTLEESGWIKRTDGPVTVSGNVVTLNSGDTAHSIQIAPPNAKFVSGDSFIVSFKITRNWQQVRINSGSNKAGNPQGQTGFFQTKSTYGYCNGTGEDVVTYDFSVSVSDYVTFIARGTSGTSADAYATIEFVGIKYNGELIFGKV